MVQEKDAAIKRVEARKASRQAFLHDLDARTVETKWQVIEHTPGYNTGGYYDQDIPAKNVVVADKFLTEEEAQEWVDRHEPDEGNSLIVRRRRLIKTISYHWI